MNGELRFMRERDGRIIRRDMRDLADRAEARLKGLNDE